MVENVTWCRVPFDAWQANLAALLFAEVGVPKSCTRRRLNFGSNVGLLVRVASDFTSRNCFYPLLPDRLTTDSVKRC